MVIRISQQTGYAGLRPCLISLPHVPFLVDAKKYMEPKDVPALEGTELRRARAPSYRFLVKQAMRCQSAEELGQKLKRRFDRSLQRQREQFARRED